MNELLLRRWLRLCLFANAPSREATRCSPISCSFRAFPPAFLARGPESRLEAEAEAAVEGEDADDSYGRGLTVRETRGRELIKCKRT